MANVIALIGSLRKDSYNRKVFDLYRELAREKFSLEEGHFDDFPLYNQDIQDTGFPTAVQRLGEQIRDGAGVLFFTPEYNYSVPGALKNAIDWLSRLSPQPFAGKPASIVGASPGRLGTARAQYHLRQIGVFLDIRFLNRPEVMISTVHKLVDSEGRLTDEATRKVLIQHVDAFAQAIAR